MNKSQMSRNENKMYEKYINEIIDLLFVNSDDILYKEEKCKEIYKKIYKQGGKKSILVFNNLLIENFHDKNYSNEIISRILNNFY